MSPAPTTITIKGTGNTTFQFPQYTQNFREIIVPEAYTGTRVRKDTADRSR
jgi:hypothetical protein